MTLLSRYNLPITHSDGEVRLLQITDTHLFADPAGRLLGVTTAQSFTAVVEAIGERANQMDAILATGDISQDHSAASYQRFAQGIAHWQSPCFWLPGNHDDQPNMHSQLNQHNIQPAQHVLLGEHWQMILLDSQVPGVPHGELSDAQLQHLEQCLTAHPERFALILLHHHPLPAGSHWLDQHQLKNQQALWQVLANYPQAKTIICGHIHQDLDCCYQGVRIMSAPSTCIQFLPDSYDFALDTTNPGWRELTLHANGHVSTQVHRIEGNRFLPQLDAGGY
ncbi:3',5'-cyclic adenosine monophosphate phosphodiesterase CpdA [Vibrio stylophorae]|uniref:3',5'-cyclic adenosine monophosphate phosphodiesterase CpdA n=1 Tax=Vibrio stylophorae TaxID=659351 RepID=A0ABM8ZW05_9VIBR|nr:3',5'-cyclic-AMP phosphodiesterase [Vibrio stylophorae]CAH0534390.1 3',5'-cyclic adenosine monophosphate phosphodiesterase CpdA [Vibrio stylophorae]